MSATLSALCVLLLSLTAIPSLAGGAAVLRPTTEDGEPAADDIKVSTNNKCGPQSAGPAAFRCPDSSPCCSPLGYCVGAADTYCLIETGCQRQFSADRSAVCAALQLNRPVARKAACGVNQNGEQLGICPYEASVQCCSAS